MNGFLSGIIVATIVSIPSGPVGFLTAERVLTKGTLAGVFSALGVLASDILFAYLFAFSFHSFFSLRHNFILHNISVFILLIIGIFFLTQTREKKYTIKPTYSWLGSMLSSFLILTFNPLQAVSFGAVIHATFLFHVHSASFVLGVAVGSAVLWGLFITVVSLFRQHMPPFVYRWINTFVGIVCIVSALYIICADLIPLKR